MLPLLTPAGGCHCRACPSSSPTRRQPGRCAKHARRAVVHSPKRRRDARTRLRVLRARWRPASIGAARGDRHGRADAAERYIKEKPRCQERDRLEGEAPELVECLCDHQRDRDGRRLPEQELRSWECAHQRVHLHLSFGSRVVKAQAPGPQQEATVGVRCRAIYSAGVDNRIRSPCGSPVGSAGVRARVNSAVLGVDSLVPLQLGASLASHQPCSRGDVGERPCTGGRMCFSRTPARVACAHSGPRATSG